jgi:hypothetical protein
MAAAQFPKQLEDTSWEVRLKHLNMLLTKTMGGDPTQAVLHGQTDGISLRVGQLDLLLCLEPDSNIPNETACTMVPPTGYLSLPLSHHKHVPPPQLS